MSVVRINSISFNKSTATHGASSAKDSRAKIKKNSEKAAYNSILPKKELSALANDFKNGVISKDEASNRFINLVVTNSLKEKLSPKDRAKIIDDIAQFFSQDQDFLQNIATNLSKLS